MTSSSNEYSINYSDGIYVALTKPFKPKVKPMSSGKPDRRKVTEIQECIFIGKNDLCQRATEEELDDDEYEDRLEKFIKYCDDNKIKFSSKNIKAVFEYYVICESDEKPKLMTQQDKVEKIVREFKEHCSARTELILPMGVTPVPYDERHLDRDVIFIGASSGAGKTFFVAEYCKLYNEMYPESSIYLISSKPITDEEKFKDVDNIKQVNISLESLQEIVSGKESGPYLEFKCLNGTDKSLVIFDDIEGNTKKQEEIIMQIMNSILQVGRSAHISCIVSRHHLNTGQHTKVILNEANKIVIFPNGLSHYNIKYCLTNYIGFDKYQIDKILKNRSRWVQISTRMPRYIITETSVELI